MFEITEQDVDDLVQSMTNYYLLVRCGALRDKNVGPQFLEAIKEIQQKGVHIFNDY